VLQAVLGGEHVDLEEGQRLDGLRERLLSLAQVPFHFLPVPLVTRLANRLLDQETNEIEPQLRLAPRQRNEGRERLVQLTGSGQRPTEFDAGGFRSPVALGSLP